MAHIGDQSKSNGIKLNYKLAHQRGTKTTIVKNCYNLAPNVGTRRRYLSSVTNLAQPTWGQDEDSKGPLQRGTRIF
jgi:hypothetical protein